MRVIEILCFFVLSVAHALPQHRQGSAAEKAHELHPGLGNHHAWKDATVKLSIEDL